jgi:23S rRNA (guanosine2251-2'-O)-methyltransferase
VLEAVRAGKVGRVLIASGRDPDPRLDEIRRLASVDEVTSAALSEVAPGVNQGVAAELCSGRPLALRDLLAREPDLLVALDSVQDPQNLGAIIRSAEAAGANAVIVPQRRSAPLSPAAVKASAGAILHLDICEVPGLAAAITDIKQAGIWCVALDAGGEALPWEFDLIQRVCVVVGGEGEGVHRLVRERCDVRIRLPMAGRVESLNASAAAAALLYEVQRQRAAAG